MKRYIFIFLAGIAAVSCQERLIVNEQEGRIAVNLENSPIVDVVTKADDVNVDDFNVYITSSNAAFSYIYKDMPQIVAVPVGTYVVSADNVTEAESLSQPNQWGQVRYAGKSEAKKVMAGTSTTEYSLTCTMANTAVSVVFGENIDKHFSTYTVTAYTQDTRRLVFDTANTSAQQPAVAYFAPETLYYEFTGKFLDDSTPMTISGSKSLKAATHLHLTFRMSEQNGTVGRPEIIVDSTCEDLYETITIDPSEGVRK